MLAGATFSSCRTYRYGLWRRWKEYSPYPNGKLDYAMFVGLNPSTANETDDDPTIRRCIRYAQGWGYSALHMANLFAFQATSPKVMKAANDPVGLYNDDYLLRTAKYAGVIIAAWGVHGTYRGRDEEVKKLIPRLSILKLTKGGHPSHPLYLRKDLMPVQW